MEYPEVRGAKIKIRTFIAINKRKEKPKLVISVLGNLTLKLKIFDFGDLLINS